jgi:NhaP-type Na+/H+ or K+/H+ antiporter
MTLGVVLLSIVVQGVTTGPLLRYLGLVNAPALANGDIAVADA